MQAEFHIPFMNILERVALRGFSYLGFLSQTLLIHTTAGKWEAISLTLFYHFHMLHRHLALRH